MGLTEGVHQLAAETGLNLLDKADGASRKEFTSWAAEPLIWDKCRESGAHGKDVSPDKADGAHGGVIVQLGKLNL
eukprot:gene14982-21040_t